MESISEEQHKNDTYYTCSKDGRLKINVGAETPTSFEPITIPSLFEDIVEEYPEQRALAFKDIRNEWNWLNYREYQQKVHHVAKAFIRLGLEPRNSVGIIAFNCPEWFYSELAAIHAGGISAGIYSNNSPEAVFHALDKSNANIVVVDDSTQMKKILEIRHKLNSLKTVIQINGSLDSTLTQEDGYYKWSDIEEMDLEEVDQELTSRLSKISVDECCLLIYTSGTTGDPKAVMLSHDNITWDAYILGQNLTNMGYASEVIVSYLPLNHIAAQIVDVFLALTYAATVHFADRYVLKNSLVEILCEVRPTRFGGVPRIFEKIQEKFIENARHANRFQNFLLEQARSIMLDHNMKKFSGARILPWKYTIAQKIIINKIKTTMGLDKCKSFLAGGAPLATETKKFFMSLDMPILNVFGMSEGSAISMSPLNGYNFETLGRPFDGIEVKILNPDYNGNGELMFSGRNVFMGYLGDEDKTREALDTERWLHTGDIGYVDMNGLIYITGRLKELIVTSRGEKIPSNNIEKSILSEVPALSNAVLVGDQKKYLTVLVTIKTKRDSHTGAPTDTLHKDTLSWLENINVKYSTLGDILNAGPCPIVLQAIQEGIDRANKNSTSNIQLVKKFAILPQDFSVVTEELGPTLKVRRNIVIKMYEDIIERLYND